MTVTTNSRPIIDFTYLDSPFTETHDIESVPNAYSHAFISDVDMTFMLFGDEQFDRLTDNDLKQQMRDFASKPLNQKLLGIKSHTDLQYNVLRYRIGSESDMKRLKNDLLKFILCKPITPMTGELIKIKNEQADFRDVERPYSTEDFVQYESWNGWAYDLRLAICIMLLAKKMGGNLTPVVIRQISDLIIKFDEQDWKFPKYIEERTSGLIGERDYRLNLGLAVCEDGHVDWAKIAKSLNQEDDSELDKQLPPGLKREMARDGLDIIIDDSVADTKPRKWEMHELSHFVEYNFNDVLGTRREGRKEKLVEELTSRDSVRREYPYVSAKSTNRGTLINRTPIERDATAATIVGKMLIGERGIKAKDYPAVSYLFPLPDKDGNIVKQDLLDYIIEKEEFVPEYFKAFFGHFRGKDTSSHKDNNKVIYSQPITHKGQMNIPYYRDGKPTQSYIRVSTGGAHGSTHARLHLMTTTELDAWIRSDVDSTKERFTVDGRNIIHLDWTSFYPTMADKMQIYMTAEGIDRYSPIIEMRVKIKKAAAKVWEENHGKPSAEWYRLQAKQLGLKFILNNATGAANMHNKYGPLPLDNKILSMRLIGNMFIWTLAQRLTQAGGFIISTNTDGIFLTGLSRETVEEMAKQYSKDYNMGIDPEYLARFINRDVSTRVEYDFDPQQIDRSGGELGHGVQLNFTDVSIGKNVKYPLIAAYACLNYMTNYPDWLQKPYNRQFMYDFIKEHADEAEKYPNAWYHVQVGTASRRLTVNGVRQQRINRTMLTLDGDKLGGEGLSALNKDDMKHLWNAYRNNDITSLDDFTYSKLDGAKPVFGYPLDSLPHDFKSLRLDFVEKQVLDDKSEVWNPKNLTETFNFDEDSKENSIDRKIFNKIGSKVKIGFYDSARKTWHPIKLWQPQKLTNYPTTIGITVNTAKELAEFDYSKLDINAYVMWAEQLLKPWKRSADVEELGMVKVDDTVTQTVRKIRKTKLDVELDKIDFYYDLSDIFTTEHDFA